MAKITYDTLEWVVRMRREAGRTGRIWQISWPHGLVKHWAILIVRERPPAGWGE